MPALVTTDKELPIFNPAAQIAWQNRCDSRRRTTSLATLTETRGRPIREAVAIIASSLSTKKLAGIASQIFFVNFDCPLMADALRSRTAWNLVSMFLIARNRGNREARCDFHETESWFRGESQKNNAWLTATVPGVCLQKAEQILNTVQFDHEFFNLLPYILEEHGRGSRASVMKDATTASARDAKKLGGVFYTPADVASYMVEHAKVLYQGDFCSAKCLDPACGTGVFFLAMLRAATCSQTRTSYFSPLDYVASNLHGIDISGHALDAAAFVLLNECLRDIKARNINPLTAWKIIRRNFIRMDALCMNVTEQREKEVSQPLPPTLGQMFPQAARGFDLLVGNPPYAALGDREDFESLTSRFVSLAGAKPAPRLNLYPLFVEMMWRFTKPDLSVAALVTPLSMAFHCGAQYENCRRAMSWSGGRWQFAFFDREPHALFGEEVKTRNAILFRQECAGTPERGRASLIETGPLRKWTSRTRKSLFHNIQFTTVDSIEMTSRIPKVDGATQSIAFLALRGRSDCLPSLAVKMGTCTLAHVLSGQASPKVFVGGTAYNFLNVYRSAILFPKEKSLNLSKSPVHCLEFLNEHDARAAFAILSSRISFWLWHVLGDGFHVGGWLFREIPFNRDSFSKKDFNTLAILGDSLWHKLYAHRYTSMNAGRLTVGFRPLACNHVRDRIDSILAREAGLADDFLVEIKAFVLRNAVVDATDERRNHVTRHFKESEI